MSDQAVVFLIHGTFAPEATWVKPDSPFCRALDAQTRAAGYDLTFEAVQWTGHNQSKARIEAADDLTARFSKACDARPSAPIFMVGHSHGGSVIAHCYRELAPELRRRVTGCVFLSTPFIATRVRPDWRELITGLGIGAALLIFTVLVALTSWLDWLRGWTYQNEVIPLHIIALLGGFCLGSLVLAEYARRAIVRWGDRVSQVLDSAIKVHETARLPAGQHLFLRATGDEAASFLAVGQFAIWALGKLQITVGQGIGRVWIAILRSRLLSAATGVVLVLYSLWVGTIVATILTTKQFALSYLVDRPIIPIGYFSALTELTVQVLSLPFSVFFVALLLFVFVVFLGLGLCLAALRFAGWVSIKDGVLAEIAIEPVPLGEASLQHLDWNLNEPGLRHGYTYSNPEAQSRIGTWMVDLLKQREG